MPQNKEATQFLSRVAVLPKENVSLDAVLQPSLDDEADLRKFFATDKGNTRLKDINVGLVDIFAAPSDIRTTRARVITRDSDRDAQHVMALPDALRRKEVLQQWSTASRHSRRIGVYLRKILFLSCLIGATCGSCGWLCAGVPRVAAKVCNG